MRNALLALVSVAAISGPLGAQSTPTADDIIARYTKTIGGADKIQAIRTLRRIGKYTGDDGFEAIVIEESSRPNKVREEFSIHGMTGINYKQKGNKVELVGMDQVEGTDVYKLKVTLKSGDTRYYYMDTDSYVPIKYDTKRIIRGTPQETETTLGDYKLVRGWYLPFSMETRQKGSSGSQKITFNKIEFNVPIDST